MTKNKAQRFAIAVCASGGGGNLQALIDAEQELGIEIAYVICDRQCGAVERALNHGINVITLRSGRGGELDYRPLNALKAHVDLVVLAGFMPIVPEATCDQWCGRMINTHPSLLPKYGGRGMYGVKVQEQVKKNGDSKAGCSVHYVTPEIDAGAIIVQREIDVNSGWSAWQLGGQVFIEEGKALVEAIRILKNRLDKC